MDIRHPFKSEPIFSAIAIGGLTAVGAKYGFNVDTNLILNVLGVAAVPTAVALRSNVTPVSKVETKKVVQQVVPVTDTDPEFADTEDQTVEYDPLGRPITNTPAPVNPVPGTVDRPI